MTDTLTKDQRKIKYLETELTKLSEYFVGYTETNDSTIGQVIDNMTNSSVNSIASMQAVQQDMMSRMMILIEIALSAVPRDKLDSVMMEARLKLSALPDTDVLALKFKADIVAKAEAASDTERRTKK